MLSILFLSPHLDDAVFSCGATMARLRERGEEVTMLTLFCGNVARPEGFALDCQTSKGIAPETDYMALRRGEDREAAKILGVQALHWSFLEAPHRGYNSPPELFAGAREEDAVWRQLSARFAELSRFDFVFCPQGLGNHVDHLQTIRAALAVFPLETLRFYRDTPYAIREPDAAPSALLPGPLRGEATLFGDDVLFGKVAACCAYESQIGFQFGGALEVARKLTAFHREEGTRVGSFAFAERFLAPS